MAKQNKSKKKKRPAPQTPAAKPAQTAPTPEQPPRTAKLMAALCYLNVLILIPACTKWRHDEFVKFHLNQGLVVLALATVCACVGFLPHGSELGLTLTLLGGCAVPRRAGADPARTQKPAAGHLAHHPRVPSF